MGIAFVATLVASLFVVGLINLTKSRASGRKGAGILQPIWDIIRLFKKGSVYSVTTSFIFQIAPMIYFATIVVALFFLPFGKAGGILSFEGDFVYFSYLLALGKFMLILNAMDVGSGFEGMGANREALYSMLVEPAFFILLGSFALLSGNISFADLYQKIALGSENELSYLLGALAVYVLIQIAMVENSRLPVDDPRTHLELTMIHEVIVLDNSGFDMGLIQTGTLLKFGMYGTLIANCFFILNAPIWLNLSILLAVQTGFGVVVGLIESFRARNKIAKNPQFLLTLSVVSLLAFFTMLIISDKLAV